MAATTRTLRRSDVTTLVPPTLAPPGDRRALQQSVRTASDLLASVLAFGAKVDALVPRLKKKADYLNSSTVEDVTGPILEYSNNHLHF